MKTILLKLSILLVLILFSGKVISQTRPDNIIILADVSKSVLSNVKNPHEIAPTVLHSLISGGGLSSANPFTAKPKQRLPTTWIDDKKKLMVIPFGDLNTDKVVSVGVSTDEYSSLKKDFFISAVNRKWPNLSRYKDNFSYRRLAMARAASLAKKNGFSSYWLLIVGDNIDSEKKGATSFEKEAQDVLNNYNPREDKIIGTVKLAGLKNDFGIEVRHIVLDSATVGPHIDTLCVDTEINFKTKSSNSNRIEIDESMSKLSWECNCDTVSTYTVSVKGIDGAKVNVNLRTFETSDTNLGLKSLESGDYNITVSAGGISSTAYITVKGSNLVIWLIAIALIMLAGYLGKDKIKALLATFDRKRKKLNSVSENSGNFSDSDDNSNINHGSSGY